MKISQGVKVFSQSSSTMRWDTLWMVAHSYFLMDCCYRKWCDLSELSYAVEYWEQVPNWMMVGGTIDIKITNPYRSDYFFV